MKLPAISKKKGNQARVKILQWITEFLRVQTSHDITRKKDNVYIERVNREKKIF